MAGEWIKMRVWLRRDPKVIAIAEHLMKSESFSRWVSFDDSISDAVRCHVTESVTVTGLLQVWGVTRRDGVPNSDDMILENSTLKTIDRIAEVPGFGDAMASVGWVVVTSKGGLLLPKLLPHVTSPEERIRELAAERKRKQRDRERDIVRDSSRDSHANVTPRQEERREEEIKPKPPQPPEAGGVVSGRQPRKPKTLEETDPRFLRFWEAYPRKVAKPDAARAFAKIDPLEELLEEILRAVARAVKSDAWTKDGGQFIPHPATWLNKRRWEDEVEPPAAQPQPNGQPKPYMSPGRQRVQEILDGIVKKKPPEATP